MLLSAPGCIQTFWGHEADVNSVSFHPSANSFFTCSEDKTVSMMPQIHFCREIFAKQFFLS